MFTGNMMLIEKRLTRVFVVLKVPVLIFVFSVSCTERIGTSTAACSNSMELLASLETSSEFMALFFLELGCTANAALYHFSFSMLE